MKVQRVTLKVTVPEGRDFPTAEDYAELADVLGIESVKLIHAGKVTDPEVHNTTAVRR